MDDDVSTSAMNVSTPGIRSDDRSGEDLPRAARTRPPRGASGAGPGLGIAVLLSFLLVASCVQISNHPPGPAPDAERQASANGTDEDDGDDPFEPWEEVLEDTREIEGFLTFHEKRDNSLYLELAPGQLDEDFGLLMHYARGLGDFNVQEGLYLSDTRLMRFRRQGDRVQLIHRNPRFTAEEGSALRTAMEQNVGHSIVASFDIGSVHEETDALLVEVTDFFVSDYARVSDRLEFYYEGKPSFDDDRSYVAEVMGFPENVEIDALLTFAASGPPRFGGAGVSDARSLPVGVRYSLFELPEDPMRPRPADDRVGYFLTAHYDFSRDREPTPFVRYANRWRLEKEDPEAEVSEPVEPIVYWIGRGVPPEYRPYVREGIEAWNKAFRAAGFENAVVARQAPANDSAWSAEDVRYSTVRWTPSYNMGYAIGPSQVDPRTGEILNADILIASTWTSAWLRDWDFLAAPDEMIRRHEELHRLRRELPSSLASRLCAAALGRAHQVALQRTLLAGLGVVDPTGPMPEDYLGVAIRDLVMHEVGHTLGLRHNFRASSAIPSERLHDEAFTREHGVSLSVMDYAPVNVALDPERQGHYWNPEVGSYDIWAIRYGYTPVEDVAAGSPASGEAAAGPDAGDAPAADGRDRPEILDRIAERAAEPMHAYGTDEDALFGPYGVDPRTTRNDLGSDPLRWARDREELVREIQPRLTERLIAEGESWNRMRRAFSSLIFERYVALQPVAKMVGGLYVVRDHRADPNARPPFTPVPAERQRAAVDALVEGAFGPDAFGFEPDLLNRLAPDFWSHWGTGGWSLDVDVPVHDVVAGVQGSLLRLVLDPVRLRRMIDNEVRMPAGTEAYPASELFDALTSAIWSEVVSAPARPRAIDSFRRNLQRLHLEHLTELLLRDELPPSNAAVPEDARSLARLELRRLADGIDAVLGGPGADGLDRATAAHLEESGARIERALEASVTLPTEG